MRNGLQGCTEYTFQVTPKFEGTLGQPREVRFETFPDETFFGVRTDVGGIEYSHDKLHGCKSVQYVTYKMSVVTDNGDTHSATLMPKASFFELKDGVQRFEAGDISRELTVLGILGICKSYEFNISAEVEGKKIADGFGTTSNTVTIQCKSFECYSTAILEQ